MSNIILFTLSECEHCNSLKKRLSDLSINYNEIDVNKSDEVWDMVVSETGCDYVPITLIYDENFDGFYIVPGKDYETEDELIKMIEQHL